MKNFFRKLFGIGTQENTADVMVMRNEEPKMKLMKVFATDVLTAGDACASGANVGYRFRNVDDALMQAYPMDPYLLLALGLKHRPEWILFSGDCGTVTLNEYQWKNLCRSFMGIKNRFLDPSAPIAVAFRDGQVMDTEPCRTPHGFDRLQFDFGDAKVSAVLEVGATCKQ